MNWIALLINPAEWQNAAMLLIIFITTIALCTHISKWPFGRQVVDDVGAAATKLSRLQMALRRLNPTQSSEQYNQWLYSVDDFQRTVEEIEVGYDGCGLNYFKRLSFSQKAAKMIHRANNLLRQGDNFLDPIFFLQRTMSSYMKKVIDFIKDRKNGSAGLLGIWGMGGVGKSSLLKLVYDSRSQYDINGSIKVMLVSAGIGCTVGQVQVAIATSMEIPVTCNETSQAKIIHGHLNDTSFILFLDDLWGYLDLKAVGIPLATGDDWRPPSATLSKARCQKVVLTTRRRRMCIQMGCRDNTIKMECFDEEGAWRLYHNGWPQVINRVDVSGKLLHKKLGQQKLSSSTSTSRQQPARPHMHAVRDVEPEHPQDLLPGMTDYYKKVRCFTEAAEGALLGVCGMRGVGKTTLLRLVRDSCTGNAVFDHIMFVGAGTGRVVTNVQDAIAINLGLDLKMMSSLDESSRGTKIFSCLKHKSFLLLLDDIREPLNWWDIGLPISSHSRQKIIVATRTRAACALMRCQGTNTIEMQCLGEDDAWKLFRGNVGLRVIDDHPQVHHLGKQMVSMCGGLPLALCALGRAMSNKRDPREWRNAYSQLKDMSLEPWEIDENVCTSVLNPLY